MVQLHVNQCVPGREVVLEWVYQGWSTWGEVKSVDEDKGKREGIDEGSKNAERKEEKGRRQGRKIRVERERKKEVKMKRTEMCTLIKII